MAGIGGIITTGANCVVHPGQCILHSAGSVAGDVASGAFGAVAHDFADFAGHAVTWFWTQVDTKATEVSFAGAQWDKTVAVTATIGLAVVVLMLLLQVVVCAVRQDFGGLGRGFRGVVVATFGMIVALSVTATLLSTVDGLSTGVMQQLVGTSDWSAFGSKVVDPKTLTGGLLGDAAMFLTALVLLASTLVVWVALMVRKLLLIITAVFAPIAFGGSPFDVTSSWVRRWIEFTAALVFSKLVLVLILAIGVQIAEGLGGSASTTAAEITQLMVGLLAMAVAGFAPWLALQFVHWAGGGLREVHQHAQSAHHGARSAIAAPQRLYAGTATGVGLASGGFGAVAAAAKKVRGSDDSDSGGGGEAPNAFGRPSSELATGWPKEREEESTREGD